MSLDTLNIVYFSPTGTTRRSAHNIAAGTGLRVREFDRTSVTSRKTGAHFSQNDLVLIALPVYGGRLPRITPEIFNGIGADRSPTAIAVLYGNRHYDDALLELKNTAAGMGFTPIAAGAFVGEHSYTRNVGTNRPDASDVPAQAEFGRRFLEKACAGSQTKTIATHAVSAASDSGLQNFRLSELSPTVPGHFPYEKPVSNLQIAPVTSDACVDCQTCVEGCPVGAISHDDPRVVNREKCISCCYCVKVCPNGARRMEDPRILASINRLETQFTARREAETFF